MSARPKPAGQPGRAPRRSRNSLSRDEIIRAALMIVDEDGLDALSMPRLARTLECGTMTVYGYFSNKADLLEALLATVMGEVTLPVGADGDWETRVVEWIRNLRRALLAHPISPLLTRHEVTKTPAVLRQLDAALRVLRDGGFERDTAVRALYALIAYTFGFVQFEIPRVHEQPREDYVRDWRQVVAGGGPEYAELDQMIEALVTVADDTQFEYGLQRLVSGLRASLPEAA
jgi:AcrR family transcriptional regulator